MSRLKEIENMYEYVKRASDEEDGNNVQQTLFKLFSEHHIDWLIGRVKELEEENKRYREALEEIRDPHPLNGIETASLIAQRALEESE